MEERTDKYKHGFNAPEGYFDEVEDRLFDKLKLESLPKKTGFGVPKGYFDTLEDQILQKVQEAPKKTKVVPMFRRKTFWYATSIAASIALLINVLTFGEGKTFNEDDLTLTELQAYFEEDVSVVDNYDLAQVLTDEDLEALETENEFVSEESLEEYILDHVDDPSIFIE